MFKHLHLKMMLLLACMFVGVSAWADNTKTEGFESATAGTNYQGSVTVEVGKSDCGIGWEIYYGNVSTSSAITGNKSAALRLYNEEKYGYLRTTTPIEGLNQVAFNAKASESYGGKIKVNFSYSTDGESWTAIYTDRTLTTSSMPYAIPIPEGGRYFQVAISNNSDKPSKKNVQLTIDDVKFTYSSSIPSSAATFTEKTPAIEFPANKTYTQEVTTATGYTGTVSYEITNNTAGATISGSTVTVTKGGSVTVKATANAVSGSFLESTDTYTLTVTDTRSEAGIAYTSEEQTVEKGKTLTAPVLTNPNNVNVTYSSDDESIATVDANGNVTGVAIGSTTITATFAGDDNYLSGSASYTIKVKRAAVEGELFYEGVSGYISESDGSTALSNESDNLDSSNWSTFTKVYPGGKQTGDENGHLKFGTSSATGEAKTKSIALNGNGKLTFKVMRYNDGKNGELTISVTGATATGDLTVTGTAAWVEHTVNLTGGDGNVVITFATTSGNERIRVDDILLIEVAAPATATFTIAEACTDGTNYYGTYSNSSAFVVPADLTVSEITVTENGFVVTPYAEGYIVPANTGVMVSASTAGDKTVTLSNEAGSAMTTTNMLKASGDAGIDAAGMSAAAAGCQYYRLTMHNGTTIGYYWGAEKGAAFAIAANKAYLAVPTSLGAKNGIWFAEEAGVATAINGVEAVDNQEVKAYNLNGQRVNANHKGIVIVNGKKYINK